MRFLLVQVHHDGDRAPQKLGTFDDLDSAQIALKRLLNVKHEQSLVALDELRADLDGVTEDQGEGFGLNVPGYTYSINVLP